MTVEAHTQLGSENPTAKLMQLINGAWVTFAISAAANLGIADLLAGGPKTSAELSAATGTHERTLHRMLRALASVGVLEHRDDARFELTAIGRPLRSGVRGSRRARAIMAGSTWEHAAWGEFHHSLVTGEPAFNHAFGVGLFDYLSERPGDAAVFNAMMTGLTSESRAAFLDACDLSDVQELVDIGGGHGSLMASALAAYPSMRGVIFDLPAVVEGARAQLEVEGVVDRCRLVGGDFLESVPAGADAYALVTVLHNWDDERARAILRACRAAIADDGRLIVVEWMIPEGNRAHFSKLLDLQVLVLLGGRERTEAEFAELFADGGFEVTRIAVTAIGHSVIEGRPA